MILIRSFLLCWWPPPHLIDMPHPIQLHLMACMSHKKQHYRCTTQASFNISNHVLSSKSSTEDSKLLHIQISIQELLVQHTFILALTCLSQPLSFLWEGLCARGKAVNEDKTLLQLSKCISLSSVKALWRSDLPEMVILLRSGVTAWTEHMRAAQLTCISQMCLSVWIKKPVAFRLFSFAPPHHHSLYLLIRSLAFLPSLFQSNFFCHACLLYSRCSFAYSKAFLYYCLLLVALSTFSLVLCFSLRNHCTLWFINTALVMWRDTSNIQGFF